MRTVLFIGMLVAGSAWAQVPPLPGSYQQQQQYQQRLQEIERFNQGVERQRQWMQDQETHRQLRRLEEQHDDDLLRGGDED